MPVLVRDDAEIYFEEFGSGFPVLLFAPGGMRSALALWHPGDEGPKRVWCDWTEVLAERWHVIAMDQRNAGRSRGAIEADHGWHTYAGDHLALMDHLDFDRFHTLGCCIGSSYCLNLYKTAPERVVSAVLQNPIGLNPEAPTYFPDGFVTWSQEVREGRPDLDETAVAAFGRAMWGSDFVFSVDRDFVGDCPIPAIVLPGNDKPHPTSAGVELAELLPNAECLMDWKAPEHIDAQRERVIDFLARHTPD